MNFDEKVIQEYHIQNEHLLVNMASTFEDLGLDHEIAMIMSRLLDDWALFPVYGWAEDVAKLNQLIDITPYL